MQPEPVAILVVELARAAAAGLALRDADEGFARVPPEQQAALAERAERRPALTAALLDAWPRVAARAPGLAEAGATEQLLIALAAAPALDRAIARTYRRTLDEPGLSAGALLDLAFAELDERLAATEVLRACGALELAEEPTASTPVRIAPAVVAALRAA